MRIRICSIFAALCLIKLHVCNSLLVKYSRQRTRGICHNRQSEIEMPLSLNHLPEYHHLCSKNNNNEDFDISPSSLNQHFQTGNILKQLRFCALTAAAATLTLTNLKPNNAAFAIDNLEIKPRPSKRPVLYSVEMTNPPSLLPRTTAGQLSALNRFKNSKILILGHHNNNYNDQSSSIRDTKFETSLLSRLLQLKKSESKTEQVVSNLIIGLDSVPSSPIVQSSLDNYIKSAPTTTATDLEDEDNIIRNVLHLGNGDKDSLIWKAAFEPIFHFARENSIRLVGLAPPESVSLKVKNEGLAALSEEERGEYIPRSLNFVESVKGEGFQRYTEKVISTEYTAKLISGEIQMPMQTTSTATTVAIADNILPRVPAGIQFEDYFAYRIFSDEAIASKACQVLADYSETTTMVILASMDRVKFGYGIQERCKRLLLPASAQSSDAANVKSDKDKAATTGKEVLSVILNPTNLDSLSNTMQLQLCLAYGPFLKNQRPFSNFIWFDASPQVKLLTRPKNAISKEGEKPPGEGSVLGVFK